MKALLGRPAVREDVESQPSKVLDVAIVGMPIRLSRRGHREHRQTTLGESPRAKDTGPSATCTPLRCYAGPFAY
jgi:hypothetical protein